MDGWLSSGFAWISLLWLGGLGLLFLQHSRWKQRDLALGLGLVLVALGLFWNLSSGPVVAASLDAAFLQDTYAMFVQAFVLAVTVAALLLARHAGDAWPRGGEGLLLMSAAGACMMAMSVDLVALLAGLAATWLPMVGLAALRMDEHGREAALKAIMVMLLGAALFAMGTGLLAARSGTTSFAGLRVFFTGLEWIGRDPLLVVAVGMVLVASLLFAAVLPLHMGFTDVVQGLPAAGSLMISGGGLAALLAVLARALLVGFGPLDESGPGYLSWISVLHAMGLVSLLGGHAMAIVQPKLKRMLASLASGQVGIVLLGLAAAGRLGENPAEQERALAGVLVFLAVYAVNWAGVFLAVSAVCGPDGRDPGVRQLDGLAAQHPALAAAIGLALLCMAGMPMTAGFFPRLVLLEVMIGAGWIGTAVMTALSLGLVMVMSLGLVAAMVMRPASTYGRLRPSWSLRITALLTSAAILVLGLWPAGILAWGLVATRGLLGLG
ncbi:MAG: hypothetical protein JRF33_09345 [Deltaproteobacteria bacterium]|nr:hypothetical protein [Deltaproteobacteria bacterium]